MSFYQRLAQGLRTNIDQEVDWHYVYSEMLPRLYNFFRYRLGDDFLAEDLTATTFEKAWKHRHRYKKDLGGFETWMIENLDLPACKFLHAVFFS